MPLGRILPEVLRAQLPHPCQHETIDQLLPGGSRLCSWKRQKCPLLATGWLPAPQSNNQDLRDEKPSSAFAPNSSRPPQSHPLPTLCSPKCTSLLLEPSSSNLQISSSSTGSSTPNLYPIHTPIIFKTQVSVTSSKKPPLTSSRGTGLTCLLPLPSLRGHPSQLLPHCAVLICPSASPCRRLHSLGLGTVALMSSAPNAELCRAEAHMENVR